MLNLLGEYDLRLDAKGRLVLPSGLKRQLAEVATKGFVIARDVFKPCLVLYPMSEWERTQAMMARLNPFVEKNRVELDGSDRILLPKPLMDHAGIGKDLKLMGLLDRVELWSKDGHARMQREAVDLTALAEEVMGSLGNANGQ